MSAAAVTEWTAEASLRFKARIAGVFYLLNFLTGGVAVFVSGTLVVSGDAAATATSMLDIRCSYRVVVCRAVATSDLARWNKLLSAGVLAIRWPQQSSVSIKQQMSDSNLTQEYPGLLQAH